METGYRMSAARMAWWKYGGLRERERTPRRSSAEVSCWSQRASVFVMPVSLWCLLEECSFWCEKSGEQADARWLWCSERAVVCLDTFQRKEQVWKQLSWRWHLLLYIFGSFWLKDCWSKPGEKPCRSGDCFVTYLLIYAIQRLKRSKSSSERGFPFPSFSQECEQSCDIDQQKDSCNIRETLVSWNWGRPPWDDFLRGSKSRWLMCFPFPGHHHAGRIKLAIFESLGSLI